MIGKQLINYNKFMFRAVTVGHLYCIKPHADCSHRRTDREREIVDNITLFTLSFSHIGLQIMAAMASVTQGRRILLISS